ncbi:MAG: hypothetical protein GY863_12175 [bacterium]|nr:hypothetical protein [bacterium]
MKLNRSIYLLIALLVLNCGSSGDEFNPKDFVSGIVITPEFVDASGIGASSPDETTTGAEAKRNAELIAEIQAYEILTEALQGIEIIGDIGLKDVRMHENTLMQIIEGNVDNVIKIGMTRFHQEDDGSWLAAVTMRMEGSDVDHFTSAVMNRSEIRRGLKPSLDQAVNPVEYTGIILDLRLMYGFTSLLAPKVLSPTGEELFSIRDFSAPALVDRNSIPVYSTYREATADPDGVGTIPLKLMVIGIAADTTAVYVNEKDAKKFRDNLSSALLVKNGKVALVYR